VPDVIMPRLSDTMEEGTLARWLKNPGDSVHRGDVLAEIETDKATMELEAYDDGVLEQVLLDAGETAPIGQVIAVLGTGTGGTPAAGTGEAPAADRPTGSGDAEGPRDGPRRPAKGAEGPAKGAEGPATDAEGPATDAEGPATDPAHAEDDTKGPANEPASPTEAQPGNEPADRPRPRPSLARGVVTSPLVRSLAARHGIPLDSVTGSGPGGRILRRDVEERIVGNDTGDAVMRGGPGGGGTPAPGTARPPSPTVPGTVQATASATVPGTAPAADATADVEVVPLTRLRRVTAERLTASTQVPHFDLIAVIDVEPLLALRQDINADAQASGQRVSVNDLLVKACARALIAHPEVNVAFDGDRILRYRHINVGIAVAVDEGLTVPVIHDADRKTLGQISAESRELAERARSGRLSLDELSGGTFTISNLGMFGIDHFTAVINPPQAAILAVGAARQEPVVREGEVVAGTTMKATLSVDHRALDGATGARFLADLRELVEHPLRIVV